MPKLTADQIEQLKRIQDRFEEYRSELPKSDKIIAMINHVIDAKDELTAPIRHSPNLYNIIRQTLADARNACDDKAPPKRHIALAKVANAFYKTAPSIIGKKEANMLLYKSIFLQDSELCKQMRIGAFSDEETFLDVVQKRYEQESGQTGHPSMKL